MPTEPDLMPAAQTTAHQPVLRGYRGFLIDAPTPETLRGVRDGAILVENDIILDAGEFSRLHSLPEARQVRWQHAPSCLLLPGFVDAWAYVPTYPATGQVAAHQGNPTTWHDEILPAVEKNFRRATARTLTSLVLAEMARHGTTTALLGLGGAPDSAHEARASLDTSALRVRPFFHVRSAAEHRVLSPAGPPPDLLAHAHSFLRSQAGADNRRAHCARRAGLHLSASALENTNFVGRVLEEATAQNALLLFDLSTASSPKGSHEGELVEAAAWAGGMATLARAKNPADILLLLPASLPGQWKSLLEDAGLRGICLAAAHQTLGGPFAFPAVEQELLHASAVPHGPDLGLWRTLRAARTAAPDRATLPRLLHQVTAGAADLLGEQAKFGTFEPGQSADFSVWNVASLLPLPRPCNPSADFSTAELFSLWLMRAHPGANLATYARGQNVWLAPPEPLL